MNSRSRMLAVTVLLLVLALAIYQATESGSILAAALQVNRALPQLMLRADATGGPQITANTPGKEFTVTGTERVHVVMELSPEIGETNDAGFQISFGFTAPANILLELLSLSLQRDLENMELSLVPSTQPLQAAPDTFADRTVSWQTSIINATVVVSTEIAALAGPVKDERWVLKLFDLPPTTTMTIAVGSGEITIVEIDPLVVVTQTTNSVNALYPLSVRMSGYGMRNRYPETNGGCDEINTSWQPLEDAPPITTTTKSLFVNSRRVCLTEGELRVRDLVANGRYNYALQAMVGEFSAEARNEIDVAMPVFKFSAVEAGAYHTCGLDLNSAAICWGSNSYGQLGNGGPNTRLHVSPSAVEGLPSPLRMVRLGESHTCALTTAGAVWCWGDNRFGQLGDTTMESMSRTPVAVTALTSPVTQITAGQFHTCALTTAGAVWCWGNNDSGQLGDGSDPLNDGIVRSMSRTPVAVTDLGAGVMAIAAGLWHTCVLTAEESVKCWGSDISGQLGDGGGEFNSRLSATPVDVALTERVLALTAGGLHNCALTVKDTVMCWGDNQRGQLGNHPEQGFFFDFEHFTPVAVRGLPPDVETIEAGRVHTCALSAQQQLTCWGSNISDQLGEGLDEIHVPSPIVGLAARVKAITAGDVHTCALLLDNRAHCWGDNSTGQLGIGIALNQPTPVDVVGLTSGAKALVAGDYHTCAINAEDQVVCWGSNHYSQAGDGSTRDLYTTPVAVALTTTVTSIAAGWGHSCALTSDHGVKCWGYNYYGQVGDGQIEDLTSDTRRTPVDVLGLTSGVQQIAAGARHTCATSTDGVKCWGDNTHGQLGVSPLQTVVSLVGFASLTPVAVTGLSAEVKQLVAGNEHTCAITAEDQVVCWGDNSFGQLGVELITSDFGNTSYTPVAVDGIPSLVEAIAADNYRTCALTAGDVVTCWGSANANDNAEANLRAAAKIDLASTVKVIAAGEDHTCLLTEEGGVKCWGYNGLGALGDGLGGSTRATPAEVRWR